MLLLEDLLNPISADAPAGQNLRYEPIYDQISEARVAEDESLPVGRWARQVKPADYQLVFTLTREALTKRTKDLWFAVWLGEAQLQMEGLASLASVFTLLLKLQETFWDNLYPEIEDDDLGMRAAPLQWAMRCYSNVIRELPVIADAVNYLDYKAIRAPAAGKAPDKAAVEALDATLKRTSKAFYVFIDSQMAEARTSLEKLYLFCEEKYRDDGPSFVAIRTAIDEVHNVIASLLREKKKLEPDPVEPKPADTKSVAPESAATVVQPEPTKQEKPVPLADTKPLPPAAETKTQPSSVEAKPAVANQPEQKPPPPPPPPPPAVKPPLPAATQEKVQTPPASPSVSSLPQSADEVVKQIRQCADYLFRQKPASSVPYLLLAAIHEWEKTNSKQPPSTELRLKLRKASADTKSKQLLEESLKALALPGTGDWLDLHRYIWQGSQQSGAQALAESVLNRVRVMLHPDAAITESVFEDGTPIASQETKQWIEAEVVIAEKPAPIEEEVALAPVPEIVVPLPLPSIEPAPAQEEDVAKDAEALAASGNLVDAIQLLMQDAAASPARRVGFQRRLQSARLCLSSGQKMVANRLLEDLLEEADKYSLESWEGPQIVGEVVTMLLLSFDGQPELEAEKKKLLTRLCQIDPARAIAFEKSA